MCNHHRCCATMILLAVATPAVWGAGMAGQRVVVDVTLNALPEPLGSFYDARADALSERTLEPGGAWRRDRRLRDRDDWHYLMLDAAAEASTPEARLRAALAFPIEQRKARALLRGQQQRRGGSLVWRLDELVAGLATAFAERDHDAIIAHSGYVIHFALDASDPFCATRNRRGAETGNAVFGDVDFGDPFFAHQDVAQRVGWELIRRNAERYRAAIDPASIRFELAVDPAPAALEWMITSLEGLDALCAADREILERMEITDAASFQARADEYYQLLDARCGEQCVRMLHRGAALATTLIVTAWTRADSPDLTAAAPPAHAEALTGGTAPPAAAETAAAAAEDSSATEPATGGVVASKNSKVYHRPDCRHVQRIAAKNLVRYASAAEAERDGKRACRTCHR